MKNSSALGWKSHPHACLHKFCKSFSGLFVNLIKFNFCTEFFIKCSNIFYECLNIFWKMFKHFAECSNIFWKMSKHFSRMFEHTSKRNFVCLNIFKICLNIFENVQTYHKKCLNILGKMFEHNTNYVWTFVTLCLNIQ